MSVHRFTMADVPAVPWKNGGGVTQEIVCQPLGADMGSFDWRVSIAHIASDGPFSAFPGIDRVITLLSGNGVHLRSDEGEIDHKLDTPLKPFAFAGEAVIHATLLNGGCHDFNVMTRRDVCKASLQVLRTGCEWPAAPQGLFMAVQGSWLVQGTSTETLWPQQGLWWSDVGMAWQLRPQSQDAALLALKILR